MVASVPLGLVAVGAASVVEGSVNAGLKREFSLGPFGLAGMTHRLLHKLLPDNQKQDGMPLYPPPPIPTLFEGAPSASPANKAKGKEPSI